MMRMLRDGAIIAVSADESAAFEAERTTVTAEMVNSAAGRIIEERYPVIAQINIASDNDPEFPIMREWINRIRSKARELRAMPRIPADYAIQLHEASK